MNRYDILEERKEKLEEIQKEKLKKLEEFFIVAENILLNQETKNFFKLAYEIYGEEIINRIRNATDKSPSEKDALIGKFDLLHQLIIPFINKKEN